MKILIACECSGVVREAFRKLGHDAWSCDLKPSEDNSKFHIEDDVGKVIGGGWDMMIAHPTCRLLTVTGNKWMKPEYRHRFPNRPQEREEAKAFFMLFVNAPILRTCIENPVGIMNTIYRTPDQIINPWQFGHKEPKKTCLWLKNLPLLTHTKLVEPEYHVTKNGKRLPKWYAYADKSKGQEHRATIRSRTFQGIADAMADQWTKAIESGWSVDQPQLI